MLSVQRPKDLPDPTLPPLPGPRMNRALAIAVALVALGGIFAGIMIYQAHQVPNAPVSSACPGGFSLAQHAAIMESGVQIAYWSQVPQNVPISGDAALQTSKANLGPSAASARCLVERLVVISTSTVSSVVLEPFDQPIVWMVILQGLGHEAATPTVGPDASRPSSDALDLVVFVDAYSGVSLGSLSIPQSTEQ